LRPFFIGFQDQQRRSAMRRFFVDLEKRGALRFFFMGFQK